ncbi:MAG: phosphoribosylanthranilate isomerase [Rickettsiales bacterium]
MQTAIKICGLTDTDAINALIETKANYAGFVHYPSSPRHVSLEQAKRLSSLLPDTIHSVAVLVDPDDDLLLSISSQLSPNYIQLHGSESPERMYVIRELVPQCGLIKALPISGADDVAMAAKYTDIADMLLFDAKPPSASGMLPGGNALSFDWAILTHREFSRPWFLSGGLNASNVEEALAVSGAPMVDVSSGVESNPGVKDPMLIQEFVTAARKS